MTEAELTKAERERRKKLSANMRKMILSAMDIEDQDETSLVTGYCGYYLQISFSELHPLMVFCLARNLDHIGDTRQLRILNELNLKSILGSHSINKTVGCYSYRATQWLDNKIEQERFFEILNRCVDEANKGYTCIAKFQMKKAYSQ